MRHRDETTEGSAISGGPDPRPRDAVANEERVLLLVGEGHMSVHRLADDGALQIGRDLSCDVSIDHPKISRHHAVVRAGEPPTVEDAGSRHGVHVAGRRIEPGARHPIATGMPFQIGCITGVIASRAHIPGAQVGRAALVVTDPSESAMSDVVRGIARSDVTVLIQGETGAGKEVLASSLHSASSRRGPMVSLNCAAVPEGLLESELFGYERGAFTGALQARAGLFESAAGGTVFLDEVGDMPLELQAKLLRAIEMRQVLRLGGRRPIDLDVRFIAATHQDLRAAIARGRFRLDLYFRLNGVALTIPPLRERRDAIPRLAEHFVAQAAARAGRRTPSLSAWTLASLLEHDWPGNVRELRAVVERALLLCSGDVIDEPHILLEPPLDVLGSVNVAPDPERERIVAALYQCDGNQSRAAKVLGVSRSTLAHKLVVHRIPRPRSG